MKNKDIEDEVYTIEIWGGQEVKIRATTPAQYINALYDIHEVIETEIKRLDINDKQITMKKLRE